MSTTLNQLPLVDLGLQHAQLRGELDTEVRRVVDSSSFILGREVEAFECEFAALCGAAFAIGCGNGTDALEMALWAVGVGPGDEVITVSHTFAATAEAIVRSGATPRFVDIDPATCLMSMDGVREAITPRTRAVIPVHLYGSCADIVSLRRAIGDGGGIAIIEDAAQAHGATFATGEGAGSVGAAGTFSFYPGKNLGAWGDAGMLVTSDDAIARRVRMQRDHGRSGKYTHEFSARNSRMDAIQAAVLRVKLRHLPEWNERRRQLAALYSDALEGSAARVVEAPSEGRAVHHLFVVRHPSRDRVREHLSSLGIATGVHYPVPLHQQTAFAGASTGSLPATEAAAHEVVSLPIFPEMSDQDVLRVAEAVRSAPAE